MLSIKSYDKDEKRTMLWVDFDHERGDLDGINDTVGFMVIDGILEAYMRYYNIPAGVALNCLLLDAFYEDVDMPHWELPEASSIIDEMLSEEEDRIEWLCDRNEVLAQITQALDTPDEVAESWRRAREEYAAANQRMQEERLADEIISTLPPEQLRAPRTDEPSLPAEPSVGLAIQFVP